MRNRKKCLASVLALAIALGDCGGLTVSATEDTVATESAVSENTTASDNIVSEETPPLSETDTASEAKETDPEPELPALHIGQIPEGEKLPDADDETFAYDLPVSFETADSLILFANYTIEVPEAEDIGTLEWSILRGEKGLEPGSINLLDEEDDWNGFEEVSSSPLFTIEEIEDAESTYDRMIALASEETANEETYDYYIRAAYYPETENGKAEAFYAAATIPFVPLKAADTEQDNQNASDIAEIPADDVAGEVSVSENNTGLTEDETEISEDSSADALPADESGDEDTAEDTDSENTGADQTTEVLSTLSENSSMADASTLSDEEPTAPETEKAEVTSITLSGTQTLIMQPTEPDNTKQITATVTAEPSGSTVPPLLWESSDKNVATVTDIGYGDALITAVAEGYAEITASCGGKTASVIVDVVPDKNDPDRDKLLDLSGAIRVAGFVRESDSLVYTGQKITQNLRVYYNEKQLTEKTDYTLSYKNNINAAEWNTAKAPSVTINLKGQYQGNVTLYYTIKPLDINKIDISGTNGTKTPSYEQTVNYSRNLIIPAPVLTFNKKKLAAKKDFVCDYTLLTEELGGKDYKKGDSYEDGKVYHYTVNGAGNYTGSFQMQLVVLNKAKNFSSASVKLDKSRYDYCGTPLLKTDVQINEVKISGQVLDASNYDYEVCANGIEGAYLTVSPTETGREAGYRGFKKVNLKLAGDRKIKNAVFGANWKNEITFSQQTVDKTGGMFQAETELLAYQTDVGTTPLVEGTDYTIKYSNAKKAGNVTVTFKGIGRYTGSVSKRYKILPNIDSKNLTIVWGKNVTKKADGSLEIPYQKNGAAPEFDIRDENYVVLNSKTDYTVQLKDNKKPKTETGKDMTCTIRGKGNYRGYEKVVTLTVTTAHINNASIKVSDKPHDSRPNKWKSAVTVTDTNGKKLTAGTDYIKNIDYSYPDMDLADPKAVPSIGTVVTAKVTGTGFYEGELTGTYRIYDKTKDISKLKIVIDPQTYTGEEIELEKSDIHVYATAADQKAKKELEGKDSCFEVMEGTYKNNIRTGTAKVTLHGIGEYGGTKTYSFKIQKKVYVVNRVRGIKLDKTTHQVSLTANQEERMLTATITPETPDQILTNPTVIWSSSNSNIATVEPITADTKDSPRNPLVSSVLIQGKKAGKVTITATTQDGNKKAKCTVTISIPTLKQANQTIEGKVGDTYQLTFVGYENQEPDTDGITFESNNPNIVSVTDKGLLTMHRMGASTIKVYVGSKENVQQCYVIVEGTVADPEHDSRALVYKQKEGCSDDTPYINKMLRDWEWGDRSKYDYMYLPEGTYHIDATAGGDDIFGKYKFGGIVLTENQTLIMSPEAKLVAIGNSKSNYQIINVFGRSNVTISGGQIIGERDSHSGSGGEWGHGIAIFGSTNVYIKDVEISKCWGDGIYLGFYDGPNTYSDTITIKNCNLHHNRRNNLSITDVRNVTVKDCAFSYASGVNPQYGIDIEPNKNRTCSNVTISNCSFKGNANGTIQILGQLNAHVKGVTIENCTGDKAPVKWSGYGGSVSDVVQTGNNWNG